MHYGDVFLRKVNKRGDSIAVNLPISYCNALGIGRGDVVSFAMRGDGVIFIMKVSEDRLRELRPPRVQID